MNNLQILYLGNFERAEALRPALEAQGWLMVCPAELMEALGMAVIYMPNLIIVEDAARPEWVVEAMSHLLTINTPPIVLISNGPDWIEGALHLSADLSSDEIVNTLHKLTQDGRVTA